jgi:Sugar-specific transcriptional regulator TrmB
MKLQILSKSLTQIGLTEFQVQLYLKIQTHYNQTISDLARSLSVQRLKIYENIEVLEKLNLVSVTKQSQNTIVNITKLEVLQKLLETQQFSNKQTLEELQTFIQETQNLSDFKVTQYKGLEQFTFGFFKILELCKSSSEIFHFGDNNKIFTILGQEKATQWVNTRLNKKIFTHEILPDNFVSKYLKDKDKSELRNVKILPKARVVKTSYLLFNNSVAIWNIGNLKLEIIEDRDMYETFKTNFDLVWERLN